MKFFRHLHERGDTVVEVLISIAVISLVLGGAFVTSNRSLQGTRDAEERSNALKMAETQIEQIKAMAGTNPVALFDHGISSFCLSGTTAYASSSATCLVDSTGTPTTAQPAYRVAVTRSGDTFTVTSSWIKVGSDQQNKVTLMYRAHRND